MLTPIFFQVLWAFVVTLIKFIFHWHFLFPGCFLLSAFAYTVSSFFMTSKPVHTHTSWHIRIFKNRRYIFPYLTHSSHCFYIIIFLGGAIYNLLGKANNSFLFIVLPVYFEGSINMIYIWKSLISTKEDHLTCSLIPLPYWLDESLMDIALLTQGILLCCFLSRGRAGSFIGLVINIRADDWDSGKKMVA